MKIATGLLATSAVLLTCGASGATPKLSGAYTVETTTVCQASVPVAPTVVDVPPFTKGLPTTNSIIAIDKSATVDTGKLSQILLTATFSPGVANPDAGSFLANGNSWDGDLVYTGAEQGTQRGLKPSSFTGKGTYSNTATQLTLTQSGSATIYKVVYSNVTGGIALRADLVSVYSSKGSSVLDCIEHGAAVHQ